MLVGDIGESRLIEILIRAVKERIVYFGNLPEAEGRSLRVPIGDDAAAWEEDAGTRVLTTDTLVEGVHFRLQGTCWTDLGWKAIAVNLSDVAAMGCHPTYSVITLGLRADLPVDGIVGMYGGMLDACDLYGGAIVGGDIVRSPVFFVTVAMHGVAAVGREAGATPLLTRGSASPGGKIAVTGSLGCSAGGLRMMLEGLSLDEETASHLRDAHNRPVPRVQQGLLLVRRGVVTAMDISDGLVEDLGKLCKASGVGAVIRSDLVPADSFLRRAYPDDWLSLALSGGEDYELMFAAPPELMDSVAVEMDVPVSIIGDIVAAPRGIRIVDQNGCAVSVKQGGWDHFRRPQRTP